MSWSDLGATPRKMIPSRALLFCRHADDPPGARQPGDAGGAQKLATQPHATVCRAEGCRRRGWVEPSRAG